MFPFYIYFTVILIPTSFIFEKKLEELHWFKQLLLYGFIGVIASVVITSILELQFAFDSHLTFSISLAFLAFGFIQKTTQN